MSERKEIDLAELIERLRLGIMRARLELDAMTGQIVLLDIALADLAARDGKRKSD